MKNTGLGQTPSLPLPQRGTDQARPFGPVREPKRSLLLPGGTPFTYRIFALPQICLLDAVFSFHPLRYPAGA